MTSFFVLASGHSMKKRSNIPHLDYSLEERKLMADILYEDLNNKRTTVTFNREERRMIAEIARQEDSGAKAEQSKQYEEKRQQMQTKRDEMDATRIARAQAKLKRMETIEKHDTLSDTVKMYEIKRSKVLDRINKKEQEKKMKLEKAMNREKPHQISVITKKYDEKRAEVLERIQRKNEQKKLNYEEKMNRLTAERSKPDLAKTYDKRRSDAAMGGIKQLEEKKEVKLEKKMEQLELGHLQFETEIRIIREKSTLGDLSEFKDDDANNGDRDHVSDDIDGDQNNMNTHKNKIVQQTLDKIITGVMSSNNSFTIKTVLPPIGVN